MAGGSKKSRKKRKRGEASRYDQAWRATKTAKNQGITCENLLQSTNDQLRETHHDESKHYATVRKKATALRKDYNQMKRKRNTTVEHARCDRWMQRALIVIDEMNCSFKNIDQIERMRTRSHQANMAQFRKMFSHMIRAANLTERAKEVCMQKTTDPISVYGIKGNVPACPSDMRASWLCANLEDANGCIRPGLLTHQLI